jgi:hypothetical protein
MTAKKKATKQVSDVSAVYQAKASPAAQTIDAVFDGEVLRPESPLLLKPNTRVRITVEAVKVRRAKKKSFLEVARMAKLKGPSDFSQNLDEYLYRGKPFDEE